MNLAYSIGEDTDRLLRIGGGYLHGTIYDGFTAEHIDQNQSGEDYNSVWDVNATLVLGRLLIAVEYVSTIDAWPVTGKRVSAYITTVSDRDVVQDSLVLGLTLAL